MWGLNLADCCKNELQFRICTNCKKYSIQRVQTVWEMSTFVINVKTSKCLLFINVYYFWRLTHPCSRQWTSKHNWENVFYINHVHSTFLAPPGGTSSEVNNGSNVPDVYAQIADVILRVVDTLLQLPQKVMTSAQLRDRACTRYDQLFFCETTFFMWVHDLKTELYIHAQCSSTARIIWGPGSGPLRSAACPLIFWEKRHWRMLGSGLFVVFFILFL